MGVRVCGMYMCIGVCVFLWCVYIYEDVCCVCVACIHVWDAYVACMCVYVVCFHAWGCVGVYTCVFMHVCMCVVCIYV